MNVTDDTSTYRLVAIAKDIDGKIVMAKDLGKQTLLRGCSLTMKLQIEHTGLAWELYNFEGAEARLNDAKFW